jgi:hypothetical protein
MDPRNSFRLNDRPIDFRLTDQVINFKLNALAPVGDYRLLEDGYARLLEDGGYRLLEYVYTPTSTGVFDYTFDYTFN